MSDTLRAIIEAATPGPWYLRKVVDDSGDCAIEYLDIFRDKIWNGQNVGPEVVMYHDGGFVSSFNARFMSTFDPEYEALRQDVINAARTVREWSGASSPEDIVAHYHAEKALDGALHFLTAYEKKEGLR